MKGFFSLSVLRGQGVRPQEALTAKCGLCQLYKTCRSPKMEPTGAGRRKVLIVGEAPGQTEDDNGIQFCGKTGRLLEDVLEELGVNMRNDCVLTNALACRPQGNQIPNNKMIDYCRPKVIQAIQDYKPVLVIPLGSQAIKSVLGPFWHDKKVGGAKRWSGYQIPLRKYNCWVCPTYHPSFVDREKRDRDLYRNTFKKHLKAALAHVERPWEKVPDYDSMVRIEHEPQKAANAIRTTIAFGKSVAIDFETDRLKPDHADAMLLCAAVATSPTSAFAFPLTGETHRALKQLIRSVPLIAHNMKFEDRWMRKRLGGRAKKWLWDTMLNAHVLDSRSGVTSLKFQSLVHFGQEDYDSHLNELKRSREKGGNAANRIREVDKTHLLRYCGLDALMTYKLAMFQSKQLGVKLV